MDVVDEIPIRAPDTGEIHLAVRGTRGGPGRGLLNACCSGTTVVFPTGGGQKGDQDDTGDCASRDDWACERPAHRGLLRLSLLPAAFFARESLAVANQLAGLVRSAQA
jgi:hypothetical protein